MSQRTRPPLVQQLTPNSLASDEQNQPPGGSAKILASCDLCRRRKVKCDRANPCSNCSRNGVACVTSTIPRVPAATKIRRQKPDREILKRITKLENLVKYLESETSEVLSETPPANIGSTPHTSSTFDAGEERERQLAAPESARSLPKNHLGGYLGSSFWVTLSEEISGLREVLNNSSSDENEVEDSTRLLQGSVPAPMPSSSQGFAIFGSSVLGSLNSPIEHPPQPQIRVLCSIFLRNFDCVFKVLHAQSLKRYLHEEVKDLECSPGQGGLEALKCAIYYTATTTLTPGQCMTVLSEERSTLLIRYRSWVELALTKADLVNTVELSTLQALVIFLVSVRSNDNTRFAWTVLSLAIRIATALGLHREESFASLRPFDKEMRRRLWWQIFVLDEQGAKDRGSDPIITKSSYNTRKPSLINDEDLNPEELEEPADRECFTDMTFSLICQEAAETLIQLNFVPAGEPELPQNEIASAWEQRRNFVIGTEDRIRDKYLQYCDHTIPFHYITNRIAGIIIAEMWLILYRPLQKRAEYSSSFQPTDLNILQLSVKAMEAYYQVNEDPASSNISWLSRVYSVWHPLAVTLAELCVQTEGPLVEQAWSIVDTTFAQVGQTVADSNTGMLWTPIRRLARRARRARQRHSQTASARSATGDFEVRRDDLISTQSPASGVMDHWLGTTDEQSAMTPRQGFSSPNPGTFDWSTWFQDSVPELETGPMDANQVAWANWECFVEDLHGPGDFMQGQEHTLPALANLRFPPP